MNFIPSALRILFSILFFLLAALMLPAQPVNNYIGDVVLPSASATAFGKYGDIPVNYSTGLPNISIPIYEVTDGPLSLPLTLDYHCSGVKLAELASWAGLGWNLNSGGMVSRSVLGINDDDVGKGYYYHGGSIDPNSVLDMFDIGDGLLDGEADLFSFSMPGYSGKFIINGPGDILLIPQQDLKITVEIADDHAGISAFQGFKITDPGGTNYYFGKTPGEALNGNETYSGVERTIVGNGPGPGSKYNTGWYLVRIESPDGLYKIDLEYATQNYSYKTLGSCSESVYIVGTANGGYSATCFGQYNSSLDRYLHTTSILGRRIEKISSSLCTLDFRSDSIRLDLDPYQFSSPTRLDEIKVSSGSICYSWVFSYDYVIDDFSDPAHTYRSEFKRLKLTQLAQKGCSGIQIPPYVFDYKNEDAVPNRLSKAIDHWGYYNGASANNSKLLNIPPTTAAGHTRGSSDRETNPGTVGNGVLNQITYPTGGTASFEYEANSYKTTGAIYEQLIENLQNCSSLDSVVCCSIEQDEVTTTLSQDQITHGTGELVLSSTDFGMCSPVDASTALLEIRDANTAVLIHSESLDFICDESYTEETVSFSTNGIGLVADQPYTFKIEVEHGRGVFNCWAVIPNVEQDAYAGGVRLKTAAYDPDPSNPNQPAITSSYSYQDAENESFSSGRLFYKPSYGHVAEFITPSGTQGSGGFTAALFNDASVVPLSSFEGYHISYDRVLVEKSGRGTTDIHLFGPSYHVPMFPDTPVPLNVKQGKTAFMDLKKGDGTILKSVLNIDTTAFQSTGQLGLKVYKTPAGGGVGAYAARFYFPQSSRYLIASREEVLDGVEKTIDFEYDPAGRFGFPTATQFTNSDGKVHRTENTYIHDYTACGAVRDSMIEKNMIATPYQTIKKVGGTTVSGAQTTFKFFDGSGNYANCSPAGAFPRPHEYSNYEMTFSGGNPTGGGWELGGTIQDYTDGYPKTFVKTHWKPESYEWQNGLLKKRSFEAFVWQYAYLPGTRLVSSITDIDGQSVSYEYDPLGRLERSTARGGAAVTDYAYHYTAGPGDHNYVRAATTYDVMPGSEVEEMTDYRYFDGLGRLMQTVRVEYAPDHSDVVLGVEYDGAGRLTTEYVPIESGGSGGAYFPIPSGTAAAFRTYEASPLDRLESETPAGGYTTLYEYGNNDGGEVDPGTGGYADNTLYKLIATDPNGNQVEGFSDIAGRSLLSRKIGIDGLIGDTYSIYDDKDRVSKVIPPGAAIGDDGLTFRYTYDGADNVLSKKIPDQALIDMKYNDRDLMTLSRDGNMLAGGKWLHAKYDDYGRVTATGFVGGSSPDPNGNLSFSQQLTSTSYDGAGGIETGKVVQSGAINLSSASWLNTDFKYDGFGRVESTSGNHHLNSSPTAETVSFSYDLLDNITNQSRSHNGPEDLSITQSYTYDHSGRKIDAFHQLGNDTLDRVHIARHFYNERDFVLWKQLHKAPNGEFLQKVDYTYNDAGWLLTINDVNAVDGTLLVDCDEPGDPPNCGPKCDYTLKVYCGEITEIITVFGNGQYLELANYNYDCGEYALLEQDLENYMTANGYSYQNVSVSLNYPILDITITQTDLVFNYVETWPPSGSSHTGDKVYFLQSNCTGNTPIPDPDICDICESFGFPCHKCPYGELQDSCTTCQAIGITGNCSACDGDGTNCNKCQDLGYNDCTNCPLMVEVIHPLQLQVAYNHQQVAADTSVSKILVTEISQYYHHDSTAQIEVYKNAAVVGSGNFSDVPPVNYMEVDLSSEWIQPSNVQQVIDSVKVKVAAELSVAGISSTTIQDGFTAAVEAVLSKSWEDLATYTGDIPDLPAYNPDLFALSLSYHGDNSVSGAPKQYNGNISEMTWVTAGRLPQTYGFWYDGFDRIEKGKHFDLLGDGSYSTNNKYGTDYTYDLRGNILSLTRNGADGTCESGHSFGQIDNLTYTYTSGKNQLSFIQEASNKDYGFKNDGGSVNYDANGNMTDVDYKKMTVAYNYLNLPESITDNLTNSSLGFMYDAAGTKLRKTVSDAQDPNASYTQDYVQGIEYRDNNLEAIYFEEGRVIKDGDDYLYKYYLKDHLGNTRVVFSDKNNDGALQPFNNNGYPVAVDYSELLQESHYYPFGMNMDGPWTETVNNPENRYLYNGKELNGDFGLDWLDYGARWYDASIGRWGQVDPLIEIIPDHSPYAYVFNNPIAFNDPTGMMGERNSSTYFESYHVDTEGNLLAYYDDGDDNVYVHDIGTTKDDIDKEREKTGSTSGGGDNATGNGSRAKALQTHTAEQYLADLFQSGEIDPHEYLMAWNALHEEYGSMGSLLLNKYKWDLASYIPLLAWLKWIRSAKGAYKIAKAGGKHAGFLKNYLGRSSAEINKAINTLMNGKRGINVHLDKIANPSKYVSNWNNLRPGHQQSLLRGWQKEIKNAMEQIEILKGILGK